MPALRLPAAGLAGAAIAAAFFYLLLTLVQSPAGAVTRDSVKVIWERTLVDTQVKPKPPPRREAPTPPQLPASPGRLDPELPERVPLTDPPLGLDGTERIGVDIGPIRGFGDGGSDTETAPILRPSPLYPPDAQIRGIEGWVRVRFTVTERGSIADARVVAAEPAGVFDSAALNAIARWRYNPRIVGGTAIERVGVETILRFDLTE